ncbi:MAG: hypothetical protein IJW40_02355 [Clostridia bacterium]|nr:hypothetical protein [Clostridia bacterium]
MYVSPQKASFKKSMRGYRARQVDSYIESLCSEFAGAEEDYQSRIVMLEKEIAQLKAELERCHDMETENAALREEVETLRARRVRLLRHRANNTQAEKNKNKSKALTPAEKEERTRRFFHAGAELIRLVGHTGRQVSRVVKTLPLPATPAAASKSVAPNSAKEAKNLARKLSKIEKKQKRAEKKIEKAQKAEKKQLKKLNKLTK